MLDKDINQLIDCYTQVLKNKKKLGQIRNPTVVALDTEFDRDGLISLCLCLETSIAPLYKATKLIFSVTPTITIQQLIDYIEEFCYQNNSNNDNHTVYVLCHFAQAELQHIEDLWKQLRIRVFNKSMYADYDGKVKLKIIDTFAHFMCGLDKVAKTVGMEKMSLEGVGGESEKYWKENMRQLLREHPEVFEKYAKRDSEVLITAFMQRRNFFLEKFNLDTLRMVTLAQTAQTVFTTQFLTEPIEPTSEEWVNHQAKTSRGWQTKWHRAFTYAGSRDKRYFAMKCYWGGRREAFIRGFYPEPVEIWDVKQMYPAMARLPLPNRETRWAYLDPNSQSMQKPIGGGVTIGGKFFQKHVGFVHCKFAFPEGFDYPCLPVFDSRFPKLSFPLTGETWCTTYEAELAIRLGAELTNVSAWVFEPTETEWNNPLKKYMEFFTEMKNSNPEGSMPYENAKLLMNSLIGKFCQRDSEYSIESYQSMLEDLDYDYNRFKQVLKNIELRQKYKNPIAVGSCWEPEWSSLILGSARATISEIMYTTKALTGHTDSVMIRKGSKTECPAVNRLRKLGSDLEHKKDYDADAFWICRSAVYSPIREGIPIKPTHHGYPCNSHEDFGKILIANLAEGEGVVNHTEKTHLTSPKEALRKQQKLNSQSIKTTQIKWDWDYKRKLCKSVNVWQDWSRTEPWQNLDVLLNSLPQKHQERFKTKRKPKITYGKRLRWKLLNIIYSENEIAEIDSVSRSTVHRGIHGS